MELRTNEKDPVEQRSWGRAFWTERGSCLYEKPHHLYLKHMFYSECFHEGVSIHSSFMLLELHDKGADSNLTWEPKSTNDVEPHVASLKWDVP